jgi:hypothetical protein
MLKSFTSEFLFESKISNEDQKIIEDYYLDKIINNDFEDQNIIRSSVKSDFRINVIDYKLYTNVIGKYVKNFLLEYSDNQDIKFNLFSFSNCYNKTSYMASHRHPGADLSMIYFLTDGDVTSFYPSNFKVRELGVKLSKFIEWSSDYDVVAEKGKYVIFTSNLAHGVNPSEKNFNRVTIASNINIT